MDPITSFTARAVAVPVDNIDTDQIIPAAYLKATDKKGMGKGLFASWRYDGEGNPNAEFPLNRPEAAGAEILIGGHNFGCGSSREHAPWALQDYGFKAVISTYFADIFRGNSLKIGLLPITVDADTYHQLVSMVEEDPATTVTVDLENQVLLLPDGQRIEFPIDGFAKHCLVNGVDQLGFLQQQADAVASFESSHPARVNTHSRTGA